MLLIKTNSIHYLRRTRSAKRRSQGTTNIKGLQPLQEIPTDGSRTDVLEPTDLPLPVPEIIEMMNLSDLPIEHIPVPELIPAHTKDPTVSMEFIGLDERPAESHDTTTSNNVSGEHITPIGLLK